MRRASTSCDIKVKLIVAVIDDCNPLPCHNILSHVPSLTRNNVDRPETKTMSITVDIDSTEVVVVVHPHEHGLVENMPSQELRTASSSPIDGSLALSFAANTNNNKTNINNGKIGNGRSKKRAAVSRPSSPPSCLSLGGIKFTYKGRVSTSSAAVAATTRPLTIAPAYDSSSSLAAADITLCPQAFIGSVLVGGSYSSTSSSLSSSSSSSSVSSSSSDDDSQSSDPDDAAAMTTTMTMRPPHESDYEAPTPEQIDAYAQDVLSAVRASDVEALRAVRSARGDVSLRCRNRYGEGLLHVACRRSRDPVKVVRYLLDEARLNPLVRDDYGRTPLHDACWRGEPDFDLVEAILRAEPRLALTRDARGHRPFEYARREHWGAWRAFLHGRRRTFVPSPSCLDR